MSSIGIVLYSYKGKTLKDTVFNLRDKSSGNHIINIYILDQNPLMRNINYDNTDGISYKHKFWDHPYGQCFYRFEVAKDLKEENILIISDNVMVAENWDEILIKNYKQNSVISGKNIPSISNDNFYLYNNPVLSEAFQISNFVDKDFIFLSNELFKNTNYPTFLKYNGEAEYLSLYWFTRGIEIYSCPDDLYDIESSNSIDTLYTPYSINHNYNEIIKIIKGEYSSFFEAGSEKTIEDFIRYHSINIDTIFFLPFSTNDVEYDCYNNQFDKLDGRKFIGRLHYIY